MGCDVHCAGYARKLAGGPPGPPAKKKRPNKFTKTTGKRRTQSRNLKKSVPPGESSRGVKKGNHENISSPSHVSLESPIAKTGEKEPFIK